MNELVDALRDLVDRVDEACTEVHSGSVVRAADEPGLVEALTLMGRISRRVEGVIVETVAEIDKRSDAPDRALRMTSRLGCHDVNELVQRATLVGPQTAARFLRAGRAVRENTSVSTGEALPPFLPAMREALLDGSVGVDGLLAVAGPLAAMDRRVSRDDLLVADGILAAATRGEGPDAAPPACADLLRVQAQAWSLALDQDGAEPRERQALHRRGITLGTARDGVIPIRGNLLPEVAAQFQRISDAINSPRAGDGVRFVADSPGNAPEEHTYDALQQFPPVDDRRRTHQLHDALATALGVAARSGELPTIGGAAPTLVVSMRQDDLEAGSGWAHAEGTPEPLSPAFARHVACSGAVQRITLDAAGKILRLGTEERVFNRSQRRAITHRDGGCIIPGCGVPAAWCEIHHLIEYARGGPTHTSNGVLLCWYHHRFLDTSGWRIRFRNGVPEVCAPLWNDPYQHWRPVTKSPTRLLDLVVRRT